MSLTLQTDVELAPFNTFGIAARAKTFVEVRSVAQLTELVASPAWRAAPPLVLGGGSNVVLTGDVDRLVVRVAIDGHAEVGRDDTDRLVAAGGGSSWDRFVRTTLGNGWPGLENLALIPGTVGAAPIQNIGAYGVELVDRFAWLDAIDTSSGALVRMDAADCGFGYRDSVFKREARDRFVIVRVVFRLPLAWEPRLEYGDLSAHVGGRPTPSRVAAAVTAIRRRKLPDPAVTGNAGSFFKNPVVDYATFDRIRAREPAVVGYSQADARVKLAAGWLVERCGWKGRSLEGSSGRAAVHDRQALVLVNRGGATGSEIVALADAIRASVEERYGVALEIEPVLI